MSKVSRVGRSFSTLPFDGIDNVANAFIHEDFIGKGGASAGAYDGFQIVTAVGDSAATLDEVQSTAYHPGVVALATGGTTPADGDVAALLFGEQAEGAGGIVLDDNGIYLAAIIALTDVDASKVEFGLLPETIAAVNSSALDLVTFVWDPEDAANVADELWLAQVNAAGTDTEEAFTLTVDEGDWLLLELYATDSDAYFRLTSDEGQETIQLTPAAMPTVPLRPGITVEAVGAAEETVNIDALHGRYARQIAAANADIPWLGA